MSAVNIAPSNSRFSSAWLPVQETVAELADECSTIDTLVQDLFADVDHLQCELEAKADELAAAERQLAERSRQLSQQRQESSRLIHQLDEQGTRLIEALAELRTLRESFAQERELSRQRHERAPVVSEASADASDFTDPILSELAALREQILETHVELSGALGRVADSQIPVAPSKVDDTAAERLAELAQEKAELENELDLVRTRAAELHETVVEQKRELSSRQNELRDELKELQRLAQQQALLLSHREVAEPVAASPPPAVRKSTPPPAPLAVPAEPAAAVAQEDPVVNSVMAQFAKLQKDVAQRRKKK